MPSFSVLIHADSNPAQLGRLLETLRPADEVIVVDHSHGDEATQRVVRQHGGRLVPAVPGVDQGAYAVNCRHDWVLCLLASESLSEGLEASLHEWKSGKHEDASGFSVPIREQVDGQWKNLEPETRLVNRCNVNWQGKLPPPLEGTPLTGDLLRMPDPAEPNDSE
jgi:hypothetical protein